MESNLYALYQCVLADLAEASLGSDYVNSQLPCPPDATPRLAACISLRDSFFKKLKVENTIDADTRCLLKFLTINSRCKEWECNPANSKIETLFGIFKDTLHRFFDPSYFPDDLLSYMRAGRTGPGVTYSSCSTDLYSKLYSSELSCKSESMYTLYNMAFKDQPLHEQAEQTRTRFQGAHLITDANRLSFVPKYADVSRSICIEPTLNMIFQLGVSSYIERRLNSFFGIDIRYQPVKNRILCRIGSRADSFYTIDLASASDSISLNMLKSTLPEYFFSVLKFGRSEVCEIPAYGLRIPLNMVSTMGNGYTFSLQTAIFACALVSVYRFRGIDPIFPRNSEWGNFGVFGDDIIGVSSTYDDMREFLTFLGFEVNTNKSFGKGPFRESCGVDCHSGVNIRGVYVKQLKTPHDRIGVINELNLFTARTGVNVKRTVQFLLRSIPKKFRHFVPLHAPATAGIRVPLSFISPTLDRNGSYAYFASENLQSGYEVDGDSATIKFRRYTPRNLFSWNPFGFELSFLQGAIKDSFCAVRHDSQHYVVRRKVTPCWDDLTSIQGDIPWFDWRRFGNACYLNIFG